MRFSIDDTVLDPSEPSQDVASTCNDLIQSAKENQLVVNCECIEVGALATFLSIREKYKLNFRLIQEDTSGRQQVLRMIADEEADFVITAVAPFFLLGDRGALNYRFLSPTHVEQQHVLRKLGQTKRGRSEILIYSSSSALEHWFAIQSRGTSWYHRDIPFFNGQKEACSQVRSAKPEYIDTLQELIAKAKFAEAGTFIIAWEPLSSGLIGNSIKTGTRELLSPAFEKVGNDFHLWLALFFRLYRQVLVEFHWLG
jgi:hypothetical protein